MELPATGLPYPASFPSQRYPRTIYHRIFLGIPMQVQDDFLSTRFLHRPPDTPHCDAARRLGLHLQAPRRMAKDSRQQPTLRALAVWPSATARRAYTTAFSASRKQHAAFRPPSVPPDGAQRRSRIPLRWGAKTVPFGRRRHINLPPRVCTHESAHNPSPKTNTHRYRAGRRVATALNEISPFFFSASSAALRQRARRAGGAGARREHRGWP